MEVTAYDCLVDPKMKVTAYDCLVDYKIVPIDFADTPTAPGMINVMAGYEAAPVYPLISTAREKSWCESLVSYAPTSYYGFSGAYLENLQSSYDQLAFIQTQRELDLQKWFRGVEEQAWAEGDVEPAFDPSLLDLETCVALIDQAASNNAPVAFHSLGVVELLIADIETGHLLQKLSVKIREVRRVICKAVARFCGLSWICRRWFLLHGSHPPRPDSWSPICQEFGHA